MRFLCNAKASHICSTKNSSAFVILPFEILTNRILTISFILNNWPQENTPVLYISLYIPLLYSETGVNREGYVISNPKHRL